MAKKAPKRQAARPKSARRRGRRSSRKAARKTTAARRRRTTRVAARRATGRAAARKPARKAARKSTAKARTARKPTRKATTAARRPAARRRVPPTLERERRSLPEVESAPASSLDQERFIPAAKSGRDEIREALQRHTETGPTVTGGDIDADWEDAYATGDEAPGGDNPTLGQDRVEDIGRAPGVNYEDNEELKSSEKIGKRDRRR